MSVQSMINEKLLINYQSFMIIDMYLLFSQSILFRKKLQNIFLILPFPLDFISAEKVEIKMLILTFI